MQSLDFFDSQNAVFIPQIKPNNTGKVAVSCLKMPVEQSTSRSVTLNGDSRRCAGAILDVALGFEREQSRRKSFSFQVREAISLAESAMRSLYVCLCTSLFNSVILRSLFAVDSINGIISFAEVMNLMSEIGSGWRRYSLKMVLIRTALCETNSISEINLQNL